MWEKEFSYVCFFEIFFYSTVFLRKSDFFDDKKTGHIRDRKVVQFNFPDSDLCKYGKDLEESYLMMYQELKFRDFCAKSGAYRTDKNKVYLIY